MKLISQGISIHVQAMTAASSAVKEEKQELKEASAS